MSILNFIINKDSIIVMADTLSTQQGDIPHMFVSKIFALPHLNGIICGTGNYKTIIEWNRFVQEQVIADNINHLNDLTPKYLSDLHHDIVGSSEVSTTIYQFGFIENDSVYCGYAYRSKNNFKSEKLPEGIGLKPGEEINIESIFEKNDGNALKSLIEICKMQQYLDKQKPKNKRVGIGGSVYLYKIEEKNIIINHLFDYENKYQTNVQIRNNLKL